MPFEIEIDGLVIDDAHLENPSLSYSILPEYDKEYEAGKPYAYITPDKVSVRGVSTVSGREVELCKKTELYPHFADYEWI